MILNIHKYNKIDWQQNSGDKNTGEKGHTDMYAEWLYLFDMAPELQHICVDNPNFSIPNDAE